MKVICIDDDFEQMEEYEEVPSNPRANKIYNVIESFKDGEGSWYCLAEFHVDDCFEQDAFIPLSEIDEMELANQRELVNQ